MTNPKCPSCGKILVLCEHPKCSNNPHYICSDFGGCMYSVPANKKAILDQKFKDNG